MYHQCRLYLTAEGGKAYKGSVQLCAKAALASGEFRCMVEELQF